MPYSRCFANLTIPQFNMYFTLLHVNFYNAIIIPKQNIMLIPIEMQKKTLTALFEKPLHFKVLEFTTRSANDLNIIQSLVFFFSVCFGLLSILPLKYATDIHAITFIHSFMHVFIQSNIYSHKYLSIHHSFNLYLYAFMHYFHYLNVSIL